MTASLTSAGRSEVNPSARNAAVAGRDGAVVSFEDVRIGFEEHEVLEGLTFRVAEGETKVLVGEGGSGKTVAMKLAAGLLRPDSGRIEVLGREVSSMTEEKLLGFRRNIGFVFQEGALFDSISVGENVAFRLREEAEIGDEEIEKRVREALRFVELEQTIDLMPGDLSGGMRRRVSIARAVVSAPKLVFYDSPTAGLDPITSQTILALLLRMRDTQGATTILATQRLQDAFALSSFRFDPKSGRVVKADANDTASASAVPTRGETGRISKTTFVFFRDGKVYFEGRPDEVLESTDRYLQKFLAPSEDRSVA
jgi:phospholipid/cholesterol/gamma-HCH transport system ATP-binding protein